MISRTSEESIASAPPGAERDPSTRTETGPRRKFSALGFLWRRDSNEREDPVDNRILETKLRNGPGARMSFDFFRNIKKHVHFRSLTGCKTKRKAKDVEASATSNEEDPSQWPSENEKPVAACTVGQVSELDGRPLSLDRTDNKEQCPNASTSTLDEQDFSEQTSVSKDVIDERNTDARSMEKTETDSNPETVPTENRRRDCVERPRSEQPVIYSGVSDTRADIVGQPAISDAVTSDSKVKASLAEELLKLSKYGWYWGPISGNEADAKLISEPDGAFLVRDSSDDRYVLTLSFKSSGKLLHARMEHSGGLFSLCNQSGGEAFSSVADLINHSIDSSQSAVFCYSRPKYPGYPSFPVRLTKPVSRFTQVRSLQYLCRFVIRQNTRLDNIHKLPLPKTIKGYIEEAHY